MLDFFFDELDQLSNQGNESHFLSFVLLSLSYVSIIQYRQTKSISLEKKIKEISNRRKLLIDKDLGLCGGGFSALSRYIVRI